VEAKGGDIATSDIIIPAGNTGIPPGPVISEFGEVKVPTKIESGSIWIANDTVVAQKDDQITSKLASLLSRLGIKPMEVGLSLLSAYQNEVIFDKHSLVIDVKDIEDKLKNAIIQALNLSVNAHIPTKDALPLIISKAYHEAYTLAVAVSYPTDETTSALLNKAHTHALTLQNKIGT
jgi:large subunit ribosomal protein L10